MVKLFSLVRTNTKKHLPGQGLDILVLRSSLFFCHNVTKRNDFGATHATFPRYYVLIRMPDLHLNHGKLAGDAKSRERLKLKKTFFSNFSYKFRNPNYFSQFELLLNVRDLRNIREQVKEAWYFKN